MPNPEFDHYPTQEEIIEALKDVPAWPGSLPGKSLGDYAHHILPMKRSKKLPSGSWQDTWRLYPLVDGRLRMFTDAHAVASTASGGEGPHKIPKYSETIESIEIFREGIHELLVVRVSIDSELFGRREDAATADLRKPAPGPKAPGAKGVDVTNPYENAITSARGRVIAAFGVGIVPAQGVASAEEMEEARRRGEEEERDTKPQRKAQKAAPARAAAPQQPPAAQQAPATPAAQPVQQKPPQQAPQEPETPPPPDDADAPPAEPQAEPEQAQPTESTTPAEAQTEAPATTGVTEEAQFYLNLPNQQHLNFLRVSLCKLYDLEPRAQPDTDQWNTLHGLVSQYAQESSITHDVQQWETINFSGFMKWCQQQAKSNA